MKIALSITVDKKSDGTFNVVSPSLLNGKPTTYNFCSTEAIGEHIGDSSTAFFTFRPFTNGLHWFPPFTSGWH